MLASSPPDLSQSATTNGTPFLLRRSNARRYFDDQPPVPVLPATKLQLDLLLSEPACDLQLVTEVVLSDVGATLQLLRASAQQRAGSDRRSGRVDDCVLNLGRSGLRRILTATLRPARETCVLAARQLWQRGQLTASLARIMASRFARISPEQAHLAGLLHEFGRIPGVLGWRVPGLDLGDATAVGRTLLREWQLPAYLAPTLLPASGPKPAGASLPAIVTTAWELANVIESEGTKPWAELERNVGAALMSKLANPPSNPDVRSHRPFLVL